jgi:hypothetical protein
MLVRSRANPQLLAIAGLAQTMRPFRRKHTTQNANRGSAREDCDFELELFGVKIPYFTPAKSE